MPLRLDLQDCSEGAGKRFVQEKVWRKAVWGDANVSPNGLLRCEYFELLRYEVGLEDHEVGQIDISITVHVKGGTSSWSCVLRSI